MRCAPDPRSWSRSFVLTSQIPIWESRARAIHLASRRPSKLCGRPAESLVEARGRSRPWADCPGTNMDRRQGRVTRCAEYRGNDDPMRSRRPVAARGVDRRQVRAPGCCDVPPLNRSMRVVGCRSAATAVRRSSLAIAPEVDVLRRQTRSMRNRSSAPAPFDLHDREPATHAGRRRRQGVVRVVRLGGGLFELDTDQRNRVRGGGRRRPVAAAGRRRPLRAHGGDHR